MACAAAALVAAGVYGCGGDGRPAGNSRGGEGGNEPGLEAGKSRSPGGGGSVELVVEPAAAWEGHGRLVLRRAHPGGGASAAGAGAGRSPELSGVRDLAGAVEGHLLVLDGQEARVAVLDRAGRLVRYLGGRGEGPGELRTPDRVEPAAGNGVRVLERRPPVVHVWNGLGEHTGTTRFLSRRPGREAGRAGPGFGAADWGPEITGGRAVRLVGLDPRDPSRSRSAVYVADSAGETGDPVIRWETAGTPTGLPEVFGARRSWTAAPGPAGTERVVVARGDRYEVTAYDTSGRRRTVLRRRVAPGRVSRRLRERALDRFVEEASRGGAPPSLARELRDRLPVAETLPVIGGLWASPPDGRLWVGLAGPGGPGGPVTAVRAYDVWELRPRARYLGQVEAPDGFRLHRVRGDLLFGSRLDSLGVPEIRVYRLESPAPAERSSRTGPPV